MKTKAAILYQVKRPLKIEELEIPELKPGQVLVKVAYSGLCRSQLNEIQGLKGEDKYLPHTLGHEGSGIVEETGPEVTKVKPGDHVVLTWIKGNGMDVALTVYHDKNGASVNSGAISTFMEHAVISENRLVVIPEEMPLDKAALLGCAIATGMGLVINNAMVKEGDSVAVFGIGGIGLSAIHAASISKASRIIATDVEDSKLKRAKSLGATHTVNADKEDIVSSIMDLTEGKGVDYAFECAGSRETMEGAFRSVRNNGGRAIIAGNLAQGKMISIDPFSLICGRRITGSWGGETRPDKDIPEYVALYLSGKLKLDEMLTHRFSLDGINKAFEDLEQGKVGRAIIEL